MRATPRPPRAAERLLSRALPASEREVLLGDLHETYARKYQRGRVSAVLWYWTQVVAAPLRVMLETRRASGAAVGGRRRRAGLVLDEILGDVRLAFRRAGRRPVVLAVAVLVLALAVGGTTALAAALTRYTRWDPGLPSTEALLALQLQEQGRSSSRHASADVEAVLVTAADRELAAVAHRFVATRGEQSASTAWSAAVSDSFFEVVGVGLLRGRGLAAGDNEAVISARFWETRFEGRADALGNTLFINGLPFTIVGITAPGFRGLAGHPAIWVALDDLPRAERESLSTVILTRRTPRSELIAERAAAALRTSRPEIESARWMPAAEVWVPRGESSAVSRANLALALLAVLVLAAASANVVNLLLADGVLRGPEMAIRTALGAGRSRLLRQLLAEALLLALAVSAASWAVARLSLLAIPMWLPTPLPGFEQRFHLPLDVLLTGIGLGVAVSLAASLFPALRVSRPGSGAGIAARGGALRNTSVSVLGAAQVAAAAGLVLIALFLSRGMNGVHDQSLGYREQDRFSFSLDAGAVPDDPELRAAVFRNFFAALYDDPRVVDAGVASMVPGFLGPWTAIRSPAGEETVAAGVLGIGPGYLAAAGTRVVEGRGLRAADAGQPVALASVALAGALWGGESAIGKTVLGPDDATPLRIVGVIEDGTYAGRAPLPVLMLPLPPPEEGRAFVVLHARGDLADVDHAVRTAARTAHADLSPYSLAPVSEWFDRHWVLQRAVGAGMRTLATLGLVISSIGIYAGFSTIVARRRREIGVRLSIGARPVTLLREVLTSSARWALYGYLVGVALALAGSRLVQAYLFDAGPSEPLPYLIGVALSLAVACAASLFPALRAARVDPAISLRAE